MARATITISDEEIEGQLTLTVEIDPPIFSTDVEGIEQLLREGPMPHIAAFHAWRAIDSYMGTTPTVELMSRPIEI